jgi:ribosomal protein S18 acetylase RimI-like enzyme
MDISLRIVVEPADNWDSYSQAWSVAMKQHYWYQESPVFDFNRDEELEGMHSDFGKVGHLFLIARFADHEEIAGVLGLRYGDIMARMRRWEPAVLPQFRDHRIGDALITQALEYLTSMGVKRVSVLVKHPTDSHASIEGHLKLYSKNGFERIRPDSVDMVLQLGDITNPIEPLQDVQIETGENYTFEDLASIIVKSFTSTQEEREIHGFDKTVTEHIQATALLQRMAEGYYGYSSDEFRKIAVVDGAPAGYLSAFVSESKHKPLTGVLGPMAVLPEYRRRGIALYLIQHELHTLKEYGCEYAAVGTPAANTNAITLYEKAGFKLACRLINLEREL